MRCFLFVFLLFVSRSVFAQEGGHVSWHFSSIEESTSEYKLVCTAVIDRGWHLYSQSLKEGGPMPVSFVFDPGPYKLVGKTKELGKMRRGYDQTFMMDVAWYEENVVFTQVVKAKGAKKVSGQIEYSVCSDQMCVPGTVKFDLNVGR